MTIAMKYVAAATAVMLAGTTLPAQADDETTLKISHMFSLTHYAWTQAGAPFTQKVAASTNIRHSGLSKAGSVTVRGPSVPR